MPELPRRGGQAKIIFAILTRSFFSRMENLEKFKMDLVHFLILLGIKVRPS